MFVCDTVCINNPKFPVNSHIFPLIPANCHIVPYIPVNSHRKIPTWNFSKIPQAKLPMESFWEFSSPTCRHFLCLTMTQQLSVRRLLEDDDGRTQRREGHVQATAAGQGPELRGEVLQVGPGGAAQEVEHVVVEAFGSCTIDDDIRHCQHLDEYIQQI